MQKKLLLAGGSHADISIIIAAQKLGYWVITSGNNPDDLGHIHSDEYCPEDYSKPAAMLKLAEQLKIDVICASANDFSAISCAYVADKLSLPGHDNYETALTIHHKDKFRTFCSDINILVPKAISFSKDHDINDVKRKLSFPMIVKPVDLSGGKGIMKVQNESELLLAIEDAFVQTKSERLVIEEFIVGTNHGYSTFIKDGKVIFTFMDDEHYFVNPYLVAGASTSLHYTNKIAEHLNASLEKMSKSLKLVDGLLHVQFILKDEAPYIIEVCRRTPGDLYVKLVEYATQFNMSEAIVKSVSGESIWMYDINNIDYVTRHCVMSQDEGLIDKVVYNDFELRIFNKMVFYEKGDQISDPLTYKAEIDFIKYANKDDMIKSVDAIEKNIYIKFL